MKTRAVLFPAVLALTAGCSSGSQRGSNDAQLSSMSLSLSGGDFSGNSVQICGSRPAPDGKYRCNSSLSSNSYDCPCFNFDANGNLVDPDTGGPLVINGLCPSEDFPNGDWTFTYAIFAEPNCMGTQLNDGQHNFTCFDSHDLVSMANPNQSVEPLTPGLNSNHVLCVTENASKEWNFESCAIATTPDDNASCQARYDCGCTPTNLGTCDCGPDGVGPGDLPSCCHFDLASCDIVCKTANGGSGGGGGGGSGGSGGGGY